MDQREFGVTLIRVYTSALRATCCAGVNAALGLREESYVEDGHMYFNLNHNHPNTRAKVKMCVKN